MPPFLMTSIPEDLYSTPISTERGDLRRENYIAGAYRLFAEFLRTGQRTNPNWIRDNAVFSAMKKPRVSDMIRVIELFRLLPPEGLGLTRAELSTAPVNRVRVIGSKVHEAWAFRHVDRVKELLNPEYKTTREAILEEILRDEEAEL